MVKHDAHVLVWLEMPSPAMSAFFLSERGDADPEFDSAFEEATQVSVIEQEIEQHRQLQRGATTSEDYDNSGRRIGELTNRRDLLLRPPGHDPELDGPATVAPLPKQRAQEDRIIELLKSLKHDPLKLPSKSNGLPGVKAAIKKLALSEKSLFTNKTFDTAWQRLRDEARISDGV